MTFQETISDLEKRADAVGKPMYLVCERCGVAPSTYYRWKKEGNATFGSIAKIESALQYFEKRKAKAS